MRYTLAQLRKMKFPYIEENEYDFSEELNGFEDIISSSPAKVSEKIRSIGSDSYEVILDIEISLIVQCSITLEEIPYQIKTTKTAFYSFDKDAVSSDDYIIIEGQTLNTREEVLSEILIEKPMKFVKEGVEFDSNREDNSDEEYINPAFAGLKDLLK